MWNDFQKVCPGIGWEVEAIDLKLEMTNRFQDCYKILIDDFCDWTIYKGEDAKYIDQCE